MRTPGGTEVRPLCNIDGASLYKHVTPSSAVDRAKIKSRFEITGALPRLNLEQADKIVFIATLKSMQERVNEPRASLFKLMGARAKDVFEASGLKPVSKEDNSSEDDNLLSYHWNHILAHFLADPQNLETESLDKERGNIVPGTAAANYNTLATVELPLRNKLIKGNTDAIRIEATPNYEDGFLIPQTINYLLTWEEKDVHGTLTSHYNEFTISPQSHLRYTKPMHESFEILRTHSPGIIRSRAATSPSFFSLDSPSSVASSNTSHADVTDTDASEDISQTAMDYRFNQL
jgi:hypothetical protein